MICIKDGLECIEKCQNCIIEEMIEAGCCILDGMICNDCGKCEYK